MCKRVRDLLAGISIEIQEENEADNFGFFFVYDQVSFFIPVVSKKRRRKIDSASETHFDGGVHGVAFDPGFLLSDAGKHHQLHLALHLQCKKIFAFKAYAYRWVQVHQFSDNLPAVHIVAGEAGDAFC